jgi:hypothetical protein
MALLKGFELLSVNFLTKYFTHEELEVLISGNQMISLDVLMSKTIYDGYSNEDKEIKWFWSVLESFSQDELGNFLQFTTGSPMLPFTDNWNLTVVKTSEDHNHLPSAATCSRYLNLPQYLSIRELEDKLRAALSHGGGFYLH